MKGVFLDLGTIQRGDIDMSPIIDTMITWTFFDHTPPESVVERARDASIIVTNKVELNADQFAVLPKLDLICVAATGVNNIDLAAAQAHQVAVCNVRGYATESVVQHVFGVTLALVNQIKPYQTLIKSGAWQKSQQFCMLDYPVRALRELKFGIIGYGELGQAVARMARALGLTVLVAARRGQSPAQGRLSFEEVLEKSDIISLHCPLNADTEHLIGAEELARMKKGALLINTARGGIVDENALLMALMSGQLGGAALDVLSEEPPSHGHPLLQSEMPNLIITPHIAWANRFSRQQLVSELAQNVQSFLRGSLRNAVTD